MTLFAYLVARWRHFRRDRPALLIAAHQHEERLRSGRVRMVETPYIKMRQEITEREAGILRDALHADLERIIYSGDHPHCPACVVGWDGRADRSHVTEPCPDYPTCTQPALLTGTPGMKRRDGATVDLERYADDPEYAALVDAKVAGQ